MTQKSDTSVLNSPEFNDKKNSVHLAGVGNTKGWNVNKAFCPSWSKLHSLAASLLIHLYKRHSFFSLLC